MASRGSRGPRRALVFLFVGLVYLGWQWAREGRVRIGDFVLWPQAPVSSEAGSVLGSEARLGKIERLFAEGRSDVMVQVSGEAARLLMDDNQGSRHQRFILELPSGHTVLVAHNIDLASRVPVARGDRVEVKGEYEWNQRGGVLHWTHRDPQRRREGGWIKHRGETYQ
ncbi:MAG: DUF3465 domain-containing protein [bacterium]|nr:DUF3465 domain-containing protein [bacterium]